jgi:hypothetical protein
VRSGAARCPTADEDAVTMPPWPLLRLAPEQAWPVSRGTGVTVALVGAAAPAPSPALDGRIVDALDLTAAGRQEGQRCGGRETVMARVIAAGRRNGSALVGMAPEAKILPVTVDLTRGSVAPDTFGRAVTAAVGAGADVVAVPVPVDMADPIARFAVEEAVRRGAVVVVAAGTGGTRTPGMLRVGAVGADEETMVDYPPGGLDVLAPGQRVISLAADGLGQTEGSGTDVAVAYVGGLAALVSAAAPGLSAAAVARTIRSTVDGEMPASATRVGIINPAAAVAATVSGGSHNPVAEPDGSAGSSRALAYTLLAFGALTLTAWLWPTVRRLRGAQARKGNRP